MRIVVDANILFSFFKRDSFTRGFVFTHPEIELFVPEHLFEEIDEHKNEVIEKAKVNGSVFDLTINELRSLCNVVPIEDYQLKMVKARGLSPDPDDVDYFALALHLGCGIWSNDSSIRKQTEVLILRTEDVRRLFISN